MQVCRRLSTALVLLAALVPTAVLSQHGSPATASTAAPAEPPAEAGQFDFLLGDWEIELTPKVSSLAAALHGTPRLLGTWKASRALDGFGVLDEVRLLDEGGNPVALTQTTRVYDRRAAQWKISALDVYRANFTRASGQWDASAGELRTEGHGTSGDGRPYNSRSRFTAISPDSFTMMQDRSYDSGETWEEAAITIVAKRLAGGR